MTADALASHWEGRDARALAAAWQLPELLVYPTVASTSDIARARAAAGAPAGLLVLAEHQSAGRGRLGRRWSAQPHSALLCSLLLRPGHAADAAPGSAPIRVGLAVARAVHAVTGAVPRLKWPNDLVTAGGVKFGGILCEAATAAHGQSFIIAGIGINVRPQQWPPELHGAATALDEVTGTTCDRVALLRTMVHELRPLFTQPLAPLSAAELADYAAIDALAGRSIMVHGTGEAVAATADGIDADGALRILGPQGPARVTSATVRLAHDAATGTAP
ncbi:MAG TPA: biotin--[acetyl-CoA-carboxylase] ligase [Longimicrobiales bacterium]|nr:biotin--[acetyl-CoA-carboxylase] ligase [Longimicrobiales bacterium]